jgi:ATP-binding cassette subfamily A (ABC1) protein 3
LCLLKLNYLFLKLISNGAGKSTTMFILCGLYPPSSGNAQILNYDVATEIDKIRSYIGFCPQHDIIYEQLTVKEHLELVAMVNYFKFLFLFLNQNYFKDKRI